MSESHEDFLKTTFAVVLAAVLAPFVFWAAIHWFDFITDYLDRMDFERRRHVNWSAMNSENRECDKGVVMTNGFIVCAPGAELN